MIQKPNCSPAIGRACSLHCRESQANDVEHKCPECEGNLRQASWNVITVGTFSQRFKGPSRPDDDGASQEWLFHHNIGLVHPAFLLQQFLGPKNLTLAAHSPYNLDVVTCDFFLFPRKQLQVQAYHVQHVPEIRKQSLTDLHTTHGTQFFWKWQKLWTHCINLVEDYCEVDRNDKSGKFEILKSNAYTLIAAFLKATGAALPSVGRNWVE